MSDEGTSKNRLAMFKDKGSRRTLIILASVIAAGGFIAYSAFSGDDGGESSINTQVGEAPRSIDSVQGKTTVNPNYRKAIEQDDRNRAEQALNEGGSAMPTIVKTDVEEQISLPEPKVEEGEKKPEEKSARESVEIKRVISTPRVSMNSEKDNTSTQPIKVDKSLVDAMRQQMDTLWKSRVPSETQVMRIYDYQAAEERRRQAEEQAREEQESSSDDMQADQEDGPEVDLPLPGDVVYAQMISQANSDAPGPVVARLLQGKYAGARVVGEFSVQQDALVINFNTLSLPELNKTVPINAVAVDPEHSGTHLATDVDRHLWQKLGFAFVTNFVSGTAETLKSAGSTVGVGNNGVVTQTVPELNTTEKVITGLGAAAEAGGEALDDEFGDRPTTVIVDSDTPIGLLFLE